MKKQLLNLSLVAMFVAISGVIMAAPHTLPMSSMEISYAAAVEVDGEVDAAYGASQPTVAFNVTGSTGADDDYTLTFQACANTHSLFMYFTILDEYINEIPFTTGANPWTWDNVEVFLSLDTVSTSTAYDTNTTQLRFNRGIQDSAQTPGRGLQEDYQVYYENTAAGWICEVAIPWTAVLQAGAVPEDIVAHLAPVVNGFDVSGGDNDTDGADARDCQTAWDSDLPDMPDATEDLAWSTRTMFGVMTLVNFPTSTEGQIENTLGLYPNPATSTINIDGNEGTVEIYNMTGAKVLEDTGSVIDISGLSAGIYNVVAGNKSGRFVK